MGLDAQSKPDSFHYFSSLSQNGRRRGRHAPSLAVCAASPASRYYCLRPFTQHTLANTACCEIRREICPWQNDHSTLCARGPKLRRDLHHLLAPEGPGQRGAERATKASTAMPGVAPTRGAPAAKRKARRHARAGARRRLWAAGVAQCRRQRCRIAQRGQQPGPWHAPASPSRLLWHSAPRVSVDG